MNGFIQTRRPCALCALNGQGAAVFHGPDALRSHTVATDDLPESDAPVLDFLQSLIWASSGLLVANRVSYGSGPAELSVKTATEKEDEKNEKEDKSDLLGLGSFGRGPEDVLRCVTFKVPGPRQVCVNCTWSGWDIADSQKGPEALSKRAREMPDWRRTLEAEATGIPARLRWKYPPASACNAPANAIAVASLLNDMGCDFVCGAPGLLLPSLTFFRGASIASSLHGGQTRLGLDFEITWSID